MLQETDLSQIDLNLLVLFDVIMRERHVGRTAARLHLSPSAVSHGLARLRRVLHDPLFLKHPKGVVPTDRATELAAPIADILERIRGVVANAEGFEARSSTRRFTIGAPDAVFGVVLPPLLAALAKLGPRVDLSVRPMLPQSALADLDARQADLVLQPLVEVPPRFHAARLYEEEFAIAMRAGHPLGSRLTLDRYCTANHVLVSMTGDPHGMVDARLKKLGRVRRVAATVPNFLFALAVVAETDLIAAVPRRAATHAHRFGVVLADSTGAACPARGLGDPGHSYPRSDGRPRRSLAVWRLDRLFGQAEAGQASLEGFIIFVKSCHLVQHDVRAMLAACHPQNVHSSQPPALGWLL
jgi:DNA-binding transcriptional LysR family regulator